MKIILRKGSSVSKIRLLALLAVSFLACFFLFVSFLERFRPIVEEKITHVAKMTAIKIINNASDVVFSGIDARELVTISNDGNGKITSISANTIEMNKLKNELSRCIYEYAEKEKETTIKIPVGSLTDYAVLQGVGYRIPVRMAIDSLAKIDFDDEFVNAGINQVKHKIYMTVSVDVSAFSVVINKSERVTAEIPVAETVISGTVPNYYGDNLSVVGR